MRKLLADIEKRLEAFVAQRDDVALVLGCSSADALPMLTMLEGVEERRTSDMFWTFTEAFVDEWSYADAVVSAFSTKHEGVRLAIEKEGLHPWPPIPSGVLSADEPPARRLRRLAAFSRELLPVPNGGTIVWTFFPLEIHDSSAFAGLIADVVSHGFPNPWCHHLRFIIRDDPATRAIGAIAAGSPRIGVFQPDLSPEAVQASLVDAAHDENCPLEERLGNFMVLAGVDHANHRYEEALEKYALLLRYHAPLGNHVMAAVALNGMGEAYEKLGDFEKAGDSYQSALVPASHGAHPAIAVLLNIVFNLANLRYAEQRWNEAEEYFDAAQQLATIARNGAARVQALDFRGICQHQQRNFVDAEHSWYSGSVIAAQLEDVELCRTLVGRLHQFYTETGQSEKERERREQLVALS